MKVRLVPYLLSLLFLFVLPGCKTGGVYDPVKTTKMREAVKPLVSTSIRVWLNAEPNPEYRNAASAFSDVICEMRDTGTFESSVLTRRLNEELDKRGLATDIWAATAKDFIVSQFNIWIADKVRADLPPEEFAWNLMDVLCDGIKSGLGETAFDIREIIDANPTLAKFFHQRVGVSKFESVINRL